MEIIKIKDYQLFLPDTVRLNTPDKPIFTHTGKSLPVYHKEEILSLKEYLFLFRTYPFNFQHSLLYINYPIKTRFKNLSKVYTQGIPFDTYDTTTIAGYTIVEKTNKYKILTKYDWWFPFEDIQEPKHFILSDIKVSPQATRKLVLTAHDEFDAVYYVFLDYYHLQLTIYLDEAISMQAIYDIIPIADGYRYEVLKITYDTVGTYIQHKTKATIQLAVVEDVII